MPIYEYKCPFCDHKLEQIKSMSDRDNCPTCPVCKNVTMSLTIGAPGVIYVQGGTPKRMRD